MRSRIWKEFNGMPHDGSTKSCSILGHTSSVPKNIAIVGLGEETNEDEK
jgi:hypothetical protein